MQTRSKYIKQLEELTSSVQRLADKAAADVRAVGLALSGDEGAAEGILQGAKAERRLRAAIEGGCLDTMLMQQPLVGDDLRLVSGAFRIVSDLTHVGEMTRDVAYLSQTIPHEVTARLEGKLSAAAEQVADMIEQAVAAFMAADAAGAEAVFAADDAVDALYRESEGIIVEMIRSTDSDPEFLPELLMAAKYFERMGDEAERIAGWAVFRVTGEHKVYSKDVAKGADSAVSDGASEAAGE